MRIMKNNGISGVDTVSIEECYLAMKAGYSKNDILYTENNISNQELFLALKKGILINVGAISTLERIG